MPALAALLIALAAAGGSERFERAGELQAEGEHARAAEILVELAGELPGDPLADDALFRAAQLYEEKLAEPTRAAELYRRLVADYPDSRVTLAATRRLERLEAGMAGSGGAEALAEMNRILHGHPGRDPGASIRMMEALIAEHPDWPGLPDAMLWLAEAYERTGRSTDARRTFEEVADRWPDGEEGFESLRRAALLHARAGSFERAEALAERMRAGADPGRQESARDTLAAIDRERLRARLYTASYATLIATVLLLLGALRLRAGSAARAARALWPPPPEVWFMAPVAALLTAAALTGHVQVAPAVAIILAGGLTYAWLHGAALRAGTPPRWQIALQPVVAILGVAAVCYVAIHRTRLIDLIVSTVRFGPDV